MASCAKCQLKFFTPTALLVIPSERWNIYSANLIGMIAWKYLKRKRSAW